MAGEISGPEIKRPLVWILANVLSVTIGYLIVLPLANYPTCHIRVRHLPFRVYCSLQGGEESSR